MLTDDEIDAIARKARRVFGVSIDEANRVFGRAVESAVLERLVPKVVFATLQIAFNHWLQHGTPIKDEDSPLVALDVLRDIAKPRDIDSEVK